MEQELSTCVWFVLLTIWLLIFCLLALFSFNDFTIYLVAYLFSCSLHHTSPFSQVCIRYLSLFRLEILKLQLIFSLFDQYALLIHFELVVHAQSM